MEQYILNNLKRLAGQEIIEYLRTIVTDHTIMKGDIK